MFANLVSKTLNTKQLTEFREILVKQMKEEETKKEEENKRKEEESKMKEQASFISRLLG